ncbi:head-tail connector protein [Klebsiella variicola subsp. variicola]|uniref:head-tail connector protein n=1 Tax=Klebsiella variicola TaxID=244366 RepID=UPI0035A2A760
MTVINTETAMEHLRLDDEIDKTLVEGYLAAAEDAAMQFLNRRFYGKRRLSTVWQILIFLRG